MGEAIVHRDCPYLFVVSHGAAVMFDHFFKGDSFVVDCALRFHRQASQMTGDGFEKSSASASRATQNEQELAAL